MAEMKAVVLFGHGARDREWARPMERTQAQLRANEPDLVVELAFLEFMSPTLGETIDRLVADGATEITVVPMFLAQGGHLKNDVPELVAAAQSRYPACTIRQALAVGEAESVVSAFARYAGECARARDD
jgi:sirohydrochlorin cobaltochelatase